MADSTIKLKPVAIKNNLCTSRPCARHPSHRQSPGVCSICVNEKLARLSSKSPSLFGEYLDTSSSSVSEEVSSCSSSECLSPMEVRAKYTKKGSISFVKHRKKVVESDVVLSKSRSMAAAFVRRVTSDGEKVKKSSGFWAKVLKRTNRKKTER